MTNHYVYVFNLTFRGSKTFFSSLYDLMKQKDGQTVSQICKQCN